MCRNCNIRIALSLSLILLVLNILSCGGDSSDDSDNNKNPPTTTYYADSDGDGFGDPSNSTSSNDQPKGYVTDSRDCDDTDQNINPGAQEYCDDRVDNDCDGYTDCDDADCNGDAACTTQTCTDSDSDNYFAEAGCGTAVDCNDSVGTSSREIYFLAFIPTVRELIDKMTQEAGDDRQLC